MIGIDRKKVNPKLIFIAFQWLIQRFETTTARGIIDYLFI